MAVLRRGDRLWFDIKEHGHRWRGPIDAYVGPRQADATWRARCGLADEARLTDKRTVERLIEPIARLDWISFLTGGGPDPRQAPPAAEAPLLARDVLTRWYAYATTRPKRPLISTKDARSKLRISQEWLADRPASDLMKVETYAEWHKSVLARGGTDKTINAYVASIVRPAVHWAVAQNPPVLTGVLPFGKHKVQTQPSDERTRVITYAEERALVEALKTDEHPDGRRLLNFVHCMIAFGCRPQELAMLQVRDILYDEKLVVFPANKTKNHKAREIPYDPASEVGRLFNAVRLKGPDHFLFTREQPTKAVETPITLRDLGREVLWQLRYPWVRARDRAKLKDADIMLRDFRRTAASRWDSAGLAWSHRVHMLGHNQLGMTGRYSRQDLNRLRADLAALVWPSQRQSSPGRKLRRIASAVVGLVLVVLASPVFAQSAEPTITREYRITSPCGAVGLRGPVSVTTKADGTTVIAHTCNDDQIVIQELREPLRFPMPGLPPEGVPGRPRVPSPVPGLSPLTCDDSAVNPITNTTECEWRRRYPIPGTYPVPQQ